MLEIALIAFTALAASMLTFFSGFGLGTLLLPVFLLFFPVDLSIAMTGLVHLLNNIFKTGLIGRHAVTRVLLIFGVPAFLAAFLGAWTLGYIAKFPLHIQYQFFGYNVATSLINVIIGILLLIFAIYEIVPVNTRSQVKTGALAFGGFLSGFFGGLSGHQGALRSAFLIRLGLNKEAFVATGIVISLFVDVSRLSMYWTTLPLTDLTDNATVLISAILAAFLGAVVGRRLLRKMTIRSLQYFVGAGIGIIGVLLIIGIL